MTVARIGFFMSQLDDALENQSNDKEWFSLRSGATFAIVMDNELSIIVR